MAAGTNETPNLSGRSRRRRFVPTSAVLVWLVALIVAAPVITVVGHLFLPLGDQWDHLASTVLPGYVWNTLLLMLGVGAGVLIGGVGTAWLVSLCDFPGRRFFAWALVLPFALPAYVIAYTYTGLLDAGGPVDLWLREDLGAPWLAGLIPEIKTLWGAVLMLTMVLYPYVYLLSRAAFLEQSVCALEVSRTLGCGPWESMRRVGLPLARPSIAAGTALALMETLNDFGTIDFFGIDTFTTGIFRTWQSDGNPMAAAQLASLLLLFIFVLLALERWSRGRARYLHMTSRYRPLPQMPLRGWRAAGAIAFCAAPVIFGFLVPFVCLVLWTIDVAGAVIDGSFWSLILNSFMLAGIAAAVAVGLALLLVYSLRRRPVGPGGRVTLAAVRLSGLGYAIPGAVLGIGLLIPLGAFDRMVDGAARDLFGFGTGLILTGSIAALVMAYVIRFLPIALGGAEAALNRVRPSYDDAARLLGRRGPSVMRRIHLPLIQGSLWAGGLLVFVDVIKELPATLLLRPFGIDTLAVRAYEYASDEQLREAAPAALAIVLVGLAPVLLLNRAVSRARAGGAMTTGAPGAADHLGMGSGVSGIPGISGVSAGHRREAGA